MVQETSFVVEVRVRELLSESLYGLVGKLINMQRKRQELAVPGVHGYTVVARRKVKANNDKPIWDEYVTRPQQRLKFAFGCIRGNVFVHTT